MPCAALPMASSCERSSEVSSTPALGGGGSSVQRARPLLGTVVSIRIQGMEGAQAHAAIDTGFSAMADVHRLMSFQEKESDVSRMNREASRHAVHVDPLTTSVLKWAQRLAALSNGAFDLTVARELVEFGFLPRPRSRYVPDSAASWRDIELLGDQRVRFHRPLWIDLGGIAKGYAVDLALTRMQLGRDVQTCINAGGDLRVSGPWAETVYLKLGVPQDLVPLIKLQRGSLASSSGRGLGRRHQGRPVGPHVHGVRRTPMGLRQFVSVVAPECVVADAFTKIVLARGVHCHRLLRQFHATAYLHDVHHGWRTVGSGA
jgi:FAD:protein FMN transferase